MNNKLFTIQEVADLLGVSTKTLRRWDQRGRLVAARTAGNQRRYSQQQVAELKTQNSKLKTTPSEVPPLFSEIEAPKEIKVKQALPSVLSGLPSGSILRLHFLLKQASQTSESIESRKEAFESNLDQRPATSDQRPRKVNLFKLGFVFASLVLLLSLGGAVAFKNYDLFSKFLANLPKISLPIAQRESKELSFVPQQDLVGSVLAAETSDSGLLLNVNVSSIFSQPVGIGITTQEPSAILDVFSQDKGFLAPRMTTVQRDDIPEPAAGLFVYNTDTNHYNMYNGTSWQGLFSAIGDSTTGEAFTEAGTSGTALYFYDAEGRGKLTIANLSAVRTYTLPDASGEVSLLGQTISNSELVNSKVTVSPGTNMTGGGEVALGSSITLTLKDSIILAGDLDVNGADITTTATTFNLVNATATTVNFAGAATTLGIGAASGTATINNATTAITGALTANGNVTLGDAATDTITFTGRVAQDSDLIPITTTGTNDLGSTSLPWDNLYVNSLLAGESGISGYWQRRASALSPTNITDDILVGGIATSSALIKLTGTNVTGANDSYFNAGNVGIGDTTPSSKLEIGDGTDSLQISSVGDITFVDANGAASITGPSGGSLSIAAANSQALALSTTTAGDITLTTGAVTGLVNILTGNLKVGNGTPTLTQDTEDAYIEGTFEVDSTSTFGGNVGIKTTTPTTFDLEIAGVIGPATGSLHDIGSSAKRFATIYADTGNFTNIAGTVTGGSTSAADWLINSDNATADTENASLTFERGSPATNTQFLWNSTSKQLSTNTPSFAILSDASIAFSGTAALMVNQVQAQDIFTASASGTTRFTIANSGNTTIVGDLAVNGATSADITTSTTTATVFNATATTLSLGGAATTAFNIGNGNTAYTAINIGSGTGGNTINIAGTGATGADTVNIATGATGADTINLGSSASSTAFNVTTGTGAQTYTSNVATGTTTTSGFVFDATAITSGTGLYLTTDSVTTGRLLDIATTGNTWTGNGTTNGLINIASTSTAGTASSSDILLNIARSGANANTAHTAYGIYSNVTNTNATSGTNIAAYLSASGATTANYGLIVNAGNVGIATTTPAGALHVVGSCVTGETKLKKRRRRKGKNGQWIDEWEDIRIDQIEPGDEILTLDEATNEFIPQRAEKLMDMDIQEVFMLVTQSGKKIETTQNHPYLVLEKVFCKHTNRLTVFEVDQSIRIEDKNHATVLAIANVESSFVSTVAKTQKHILYRHYKARNRPKLFGPEIFACMIIATMKKFEIPVTQLVIDREYSEQYDKLIAQTIEAVFPEITIHIRSVGKNSPAHIVGIDAMRRNKISKKEEVVAGSKLYGFPAAELLHPEFTGIRSPHYLLLSKNNITKWEKVKYIKPGMTIATINGWEKVSAVYSVGRKQTYDIQVANTHNFVGNGIVAHNTYIMSGNIGLGTTTPTSELYVTRPLSFGVTGKALAVFDQIESQDILTASASGTTRFTIENDGDVVIGGDLAVNGGDLTTTATTFNLVNATATTISFAGAATTALNIGNGNTAYTAINIGSGTGGNTINIAGTGATGADTINIGTGGTGADTVNIGSSASSTAFNVTTGTGAQTYTSNVATGTTTTSGFVFDATAITSGTGIYAITDSVTTGRLLDIATTGNTWTGNGTTNGLVNLASTSTAGTASSSDILLNIARSGANANTAHTAYGIYSNVTNTNATSGTNIAAYLSASGATTANYGLIVNAGNVGIGDTSPAALFVVGDGDDFQVDSTGDIILNQTTPNIAIGNTGTLTITDGTNTLFSIADDTSEGDVTVTGDLAVNGATSADITTSTTTATVFNATATTLSLGGAATTALNIGNGNTAYTAINIGSGTGGNTINIAGTGATGADTINIGTGGTGADTINLGSSASSTAFNVTTGTGAQTYTSNVATGTTTTSGFVFDATAITSGTGIYAVTDSVTTGRLLDIATTGNTWTGNGTTNGLVNLASTSTAGTASSSDIILNIARSGANANTAHTAYGIYSNVTNTNATSGTNIAAYLSASGATTANYGLLVENGSVGIGTVTPAAKLTIDNADTAANLKSLVITHRDGGSKIATFQDASGGAIYDFTFGTSGGDPIMAIMDMYGGGSNPATGGNPFLRLNSSRGSLASPTVVVSADELGRIAWQGYDGANYQEAARIKGEVDGTPGTSDMPGRLLFFTTPDGSATPAERMRITQAGNVGLGGQTAPLTALDVTGSASLSANLSLRGAATAHTFNILDNGTLNFQRSPGGDAGLATALFIQNNGNVGIGDNTPSAKLDIAGATAQLTGANGTSNTTLTVENTSNTGATSENAIVDIRVGGTTTTGDAQLRFTVPGGDSWYIANDNSNADTLLIGTGTTPGTAGTIALFDPRTTVSVGGIVRVFGTGLTEPTYTIASGASATGPGAFLVDSLTVNFTGTTQVTSLGTWVTLKGPTLAGNTATLTYDKYTTLQLTPAIEGTNVSLTDSSALRILNQGTGVPTNQYGMFVEALTSGTNNYGLYITAPTGTIAEAIHTTGGAVSLNDQHILRVASGSETVFNETQIDIDFRIESDNNANMFTLDAGTDSLALGGAVTSGSFLTLADNAQARTLITSVGYGLHEATSTMTDNGGARTVAVGARNFLGTPTITNASNAVTFTRAANLFIAGPATAGTNVTLSRAYSLHINDGVSLIGANGSSGGSILSPSLSASIAPLILSVNLSTADVGGLALWNSRDDAVSDKGPALMFYNTAGTGTISRQGYIRTSTSDGTVNAQMIFATTISGTEGERMRINANGNLGVGVTGPSLRLDVQDTQSATAAAQIYNTNSGTDADGLIVKLGNTSSTVVSSTNHFMSFETFGIGIVGSVQGSGGKGVTYATSGIADFAEYFRKDANQDIPYGSAVCFDDSGLAVKCDNSNNRIIGVASERPAFLGGENLGNKSVAVGLVGQVRTRVSTANGPIKIGDPLTTSSIPGIAVKATSVGQILGKAIEPLDCHPDPERREGEGSRDSSASPQNDNTCQGEILVSVNITWYNPSVYVAMDGTLAGITATVASIGDQLTLQSDTLQALQASSSAQVNYVLSEDSIFKDLKDKVSSLESKIDLLNLQFEQNASTSGLLGQIQSGQVLGASTSAALALGNVELNNATISDNLMVLGRTTVTDLGVTGNINAGLLAIHGLDGEINTLSGDLYLQKDRLGGVNIFDGKIVMDTKGNLTVSGTVTADSVEAKNYTVLGDQSIGSGTIAAGETSVEVSTSIASSSSKIFLTMTSLTDKQVTVVEKKDGKFKVAIPQPTSSPISFDWWIVGNR